MSPLRAHAWTRLYGHVPTELLPPLFSIAWAAVVFRELTARLGGAWSNGEVATLFGSLLFAWLLWRTGAVLADHKHSKRRAACGARDHVVAIDVSFSRCSRGTSRPAAARSSWRQARSPLRRHASG